jgi:hypothetical protein
VEFRSIARRCFYLLGQPLDSAKKLRLQEAYFEFVAAVNNGADNLEKLGDALDDVYLELKAG